jgi:hypothetical protein
LKKMRSRRERALEIDQDQAARFRHPDQFRDGVSTYYRFRSASDFPAPVSLAL